MTVSFVGSASAEATSLTLPAHQAGDLIVMLAYRSAYDLPTIPSGWKVTNSNGSATLTVSLTVAWKTAASSAETSGTWTSAALLLAAVYRDDANFLTLWSRGGNTQVGATSITYNAFAAQTATPVNASVNRMQQATGWITAAAWSADRTAAIDTAPAGMSARANVQGASVNRLALHDTNAAVSSFSSASVALGVISGVIHSLHEIIDTGAAKAAAGGMLIHPGMSGGMGG